MKPEKNMTYILWGAVFPYEKVFLPLDRGLILDDFKIINFGWPNHSPFQSQMMRVLNIQDIFRALYERKDMVICLDNRQAKTLKKFMLEHYGIRINFLKYFNRHSINFYKVVSVDTHGLTPMVLSK